MAQLTGQLTEHLSGKDRLIVALDLPTVDQALRVVDELESVLFFKVGLQLFMTGGLPTLLESLGHKDKKVFVDLKLPGDISNTIAAVVDQSVAMRVTFLTVSESMPAPAIAVARAAREARNSREPKLLTVPFLSSLDSADLTAAADPPTAGAEQPDLETFILKRARAAIQAGCDGVIASGRAIGVCRQGLPPSTIIVSPGIRPSGASSDDHKRHTTPTDAIRLGADYLVVGRPILKDPRPRQAALRIIDEIDAALSVAVSGRETN